MSLPTEKQINRLFAENERIKQVLARFDIESASYRSALVALNKEIDALAAAIHELADKQIEIEDLKIIKGFIVFR